ncbi:MAG: NADH:ubiquinone oxidoreductase subunit NDUFA12 [Rickettsiales bacterium]|nr:NADH:ubiquinone oxidoreductase subunit NDUFA12 [Rickettsiales bacterium]
MSATIGTKLHTWMYGKFVGRDVFGNRYFESKRASKGEKKRRWVMYHGMAEASKVPATWHGWLHYTLDAPLPEAKQYNWLKAHLPNLTGTTGRYLPQGHISKAGARAAAAADYEPWTPQ